MNQHLSAKTLAPLALALSVATQTAAAQTRSIESVSRLARGSVVVIECTASQAMGSGFALADGDLIATNAHVVEGCQEVSIRGEQGVWFGQARVLHRDAERDVAIVYLPGGLLPALLLRDRPVAPGREVIALGHPAGFEYTVSTGIVSAVRQREDLTLVQTTAPISPGSSGGPLLDETGQVIAMNALTHRTAQNLNMAVSARHVRDALELAQLRLEVRPDRSARASGQAELGHVLALAHDLRLDGQLDQASRTLDLAADQGALGVLQQRAEIAWDRQDYPEAERLVQLMLTIDPNYPPAHQSRGALLMQRERYQEGCAAQQRAIDLGADPEYTAYAEAMLAECAVHSEDTEGAIGHLSRALQHPTIARHATAHGQLAALLATAARPYEAHAAAVRALALTEEGDLASALEFLGHYGLPLTPEISTGDGGWTPEGHFEVRGIVLNATPDTHQNLTVLVECMDGAGTIVASGSGPLSSPALKPATSGSFHVRVGGLPERGVRYEARIVY